MNMPYDGGQAAELAAFEQQYQQQTGVDPNAAYGARPTNQAAPPVPGQATLASQAPPAPQQHMQQRQEAMPIPHYDPPPDPHAMPAAQPQPQPQVSFGQQPGAADTRSPGQQQIPLAAVQDERRRRQEAEAETGRIRQALEANTDKQRRLEERIAMLGEAVSRGQQSELDRLNGQNDQIPSFDDDPERHIAAVNEIAAKRAEERIAKLEEQTKQQQEIIDQETFERDIKSRVTNQFADFETKVPDVGRAYDFLIRSRKAELIEQGFDPADVAKHVEGEEMMLAQAHLSHNRNVPEAFYRAAMSRGYRPQGQQQQQQQQVQSEYPQPGAADTRSPGPQTTLAPQPAPGPQAQQYAQPQQQPLPGSGLQPYQAPAYQPQPVPYLAPPAPGQYQGGPTLDSMQAGMMAGSHLADTAGMGVGPAAGNQMFPTLDQLNQMDEEQLMANIGAVNAHIEGLRRAGH